MELQREPPRPPPDRPPQSTIRADPIAAFRADGEILGAVLDLARHLFGVPLACLNLLDGSRFLATTCRGPHCDIVHDQHYLDRQFAPVADPVVIPDLRYDTRCSTNPFVVGAPYLRFYAACPILDPNGSAIGVVSLASPSENVFFTEAQLLLLRQLAATAFDRLALRQLEVARDATQARFEKIAATSPDGIVCADAAGRITFWNAAAERIFGYSAQEAEGQSINIIVPERLRLGHASGFGGLSAIEVPHLAGRTVELIGCRRDGAEFPIELSLCIWSESQDAGFGIILRDISERRAAEARLIRLTDHDPLTGLPNRGVLRHRIEQLGNGMQGATLLVVDLDGFKTVNDDLGHVAGDEVLRQVAERLRASVGPGDLVARLGGDEFAILLCEERKPGDGAAARGGAIVNALEQPFILRDATIALGASVGSATYPVHGVTTDELLSNADLALHQAKRWGRHVHVPFSPPLREAADRRRAYGRELGLALRREEFEIFYQKQVRLSDLRAVGAEALLRWRHPRDGLLPPSRFLDALESRPLSARVGYWMLRTACAQARAWRDAGSPEFRISVNLFGSQFHVGDLVEEVRQALAAAGLPGDALELELTENIALHHDETILQPLQAVRALGVGLAFDDFGTGYGSLSMLRRLPVTRLKVDRGFVRDMVHVQHDSAIVRSILMLGRTLGLGVIAEGVETAEQLATLRRLGCREAQGYLFGRPMPADTLTADLLADAPLPVQRPRAIG